MLGQESGETFCLPKKRSTNSAVTSDRKCASINDGDGERTCMDAFAGGTGKRCDIGR